MMAPTAWYLTLTVLGWLAFPLAYRLLPALPDRGYALSRSLGWLVWGFIFWLLASLGVLPNNPGGLTAAAIGLGLLSLWALMGITPAELLGWLRRSLGYLLSVEILFLLAFLAWSVVRAAMPEAIGTEKPMELAFINAILRSPTFPPHDPWLAGYGISYYYFGYVLVAMLAQFTGTAGSVAFNLGGISVFALAAIGAYGLVYNLISAGSMPVEAADDATAGKKPLRGPLAWLAAILGPLFLLLVSNLEGFLHMLHTRGLFWSRTADGEWVSAFWSWLDILDLKSAPAEPLSWAPERYYWWWRASRVIGDYDLAGSAKEVINEFPFFSFLLADLHPHVLAIPFGLLCIALALNLFLGGGQYSGPAYRRQIGRSWLLLAAWVTVALGLALAGTALLALNLGLGIAGLAALLLAGGLYAVASGEAADTPLTLTWPQSLHPAVLALCAVALGGMAFMNTWDFPVYLALAAAAFALRNARATHKPLGSILIEFFALATVLGVIGVLLYLPFYLGFSSQAGGPLPNMIYPTRGAHLWVMFGPLFLPIFGFLLFQVRRERRLRWLGNGLLTALGLVLLLAALALLSGVLIANLPLVGSMFLGSLAAPDLNTLIDAFFSRRLAQPGGWITLTLLLGLILAALWPHLFAAKQRPAQDDAPPSNGHEPAAGFALLLALFGTLLVLGPEFFFLRDLFGWRINTIFKFYYQAWLLWSILAAYASLLLLRRLPGGPATLFGLLLIPTLAAALVYPALSLPSKANGFKPAVWTLDGAAYFARQAPEEYAAILWLKSAPLGTVAEAVPAGGGSYTEYGRAATLSGQPGLLGWVGHENQWRGDTAPDTIGTRQADLERLFCSRNWREARDVLEQYQIRYIYIGNLERSTYNTPTPTCPMGLVAVKFERNLTPAFEAGSVVIYEYIGPADE